MSSVDRADLSCGAPVGLFATFLSVALATVVSVALLSCGVAAADTVETNFEAPTFHLGSVNAQDGWTSSVGLNKGAGPHGYDQEVVDNNALTPRVAPAEFGGQSLRISNAYMSQEFEGQTRSNATKEAAGESLPNTEYTAQFSFISFKPTVEQPGLLVSVSPTEYLGARMSYIGLKDTPEGIAVSFYDTPQPDGEFAAYNLGVLSRDQPHTIKFWIRLVPGESNDLVRISIDGRDVGECFTTWENMYRAEHLGVPNIDLLEFRTGGVAGETPSLLGGGFLFDNVKITTAKGASAGPPTCELPIEKEAQARTVRPGGRVRYRLSVRNRGRLGASNVLICDRIPREMTFVSADRKLRRLGDRRCLLIPHLAPGQRVTFHPVLRVDANAPPGEVDNVEEETPGVELPDTVPPGAEPPGVEPPHYLPLPDPQLVSLPPKAKIGPLSPAVQATAKVTVVRAKRHPPRPVPPVTG